MRDEDVADGIGLTARKGPGMEKYEKRRTAFVFISLILLFIALAFRLVYLQGVKSKHFLALAQEQHNCLILLPPRRGLIYDRNRKELAINTTAFSVYARVKEVADIDQTSRKLAKSLSLKKEEALKILSKDDPFVWIKRKTSKVEAEEVRSFNLPGIGLREEEKRCYPKGDLACHLLGFAGIDNDGLEGLEFFYDNYLKGRPGWIRTERDGTRRELSSFTKEVIPATDGYNLILTLDSVLQYIAEKELEEGIRRYRAAGGTVIFMNPRSGEVLALANFPKFDPNRFSDFDKDSFRNRAVTDIIEPGSTFKIVTAAAALEERIAEEKDEFFCEQGVFVFRGRTLHDYHPFGTLTFREIIEKSSNIGVVKVALLIGEEKLYHYIKSFGFGEKKNIDLPGEAAGIVHPPHAWSKASIMAVPIGHEVAVTPLQIACAISAIANQGVMMRPYLVKSIQDRSQVTIRSFPAGEIRRVMTEETSSRLTEILIGAVKEGTGQAAAIPGFEVAGKTGTSQKLESDGRYSHRRFLSLFAGFVPAREPRLAGVVIIDEPGGAYYGGRVAAPIFQRIASQFLAHRKD